MAMRKAMPADKLQETWKSLTTKVGAFKEQKGVRTDHTPKYKIVFVRCVFGQATLDAKVCSLRMVDG